MGLAAFNRMRRERAKEVAQAEKSAESASGAAKDLEREALAAEYEERTGKKAGNMKIDTLRKKLDEAEKEKQNEAHVDEDSNASETEQDAHEAAQNESGDKVQAKE